MRVGSGDGEFVEIRLLRRTHPQASDYWDANWLCAAVDAASHRLSGSLEASLRVGELISLRDKLAVLHRELRGRVEFWPMEPTIKLTFEALENGGITVFCQLQPDLADAACLVFELSLDQTYLPGILSELDADLASFPLLGDPDAA